MAAAQGGDVEGSVAGDVVTTDHGVTIIGYTDLPARLPAQASQALRHQRAEPAQADGPGKDGHLQLDLNDIVVRGITVAHAGETLWPPPPVSVSAAPAAQPAAAPVEKEPEKERSPLARAAVGVVGALALFGVTGFAPRRR
ncbi:hypothetical protein ACL02T_22700 [Pseudonocardia sp. RS010]|uniref:hypothetical protein n=1 Tax=Pseudonocardia sp. RS010 TaxID=3385979 RepID=UPI0039A1AECF